MRKIGELFSRHVGATAWIFGKGPSLDAFPMDSAGTLRMCINESLLAVPSPTYFFAHDEPPIRRVAQAWPQGCAGILQQVRADLAHDCGIPEDSLYVYEKRYADNHVRDMDAQALAESHCLYGNSGTVHCAIHFCRLIGAPRLMLVGCDGRGGYARAVGLPDGGAEHERIRRDAISLMDTMGLDYEFFQPQVAQAKTNVEGS